MTRTRLFALYILILSLHLLHIRSFVTSQHASVIMLHNACADSTTTIQCPNRFAIIVVRASYGVAQQNGSCVYEQGDCIVDASDSVTCAFDSQPCAIFVQKKKLPQCNNQYNSYLHIEYQCVPIFMDESSKEYNICQDGTDITSDHGVIQSPGYPSQFQTTTTDCFRAIHVPDDKVIQLWLIDLYIGSTMISNCAKDHVLVVDSTQTFRHCGLNRYVYPYLCSSTIFIHYMAYSKASYYRGMKMYFQIVARDPDDDCSEVSVTPEPVSTTTPMSLEPTTTTNTPIFALLGIASPTLSVQLCKGQSQLIECPATYVVAMTTHIYGVTQSNQCEPHDSTKHCVVPMEPSFSCQQQCTLLYSGNQHIPSCNNQVAAYQYIEYQCIPTQTPLVTTNTPCPVDGSKIPLQIVRNGRFRNVDYPALKEINCTYRVTTIPGSIMNVYSLDISLNDYLSDCNRGNQLTITEDGESRGEIFCEERNYQLIYSSCSNEFDLNYAITNTSPLSFTGAELYIESQVRPVDWSCGRPLPTTPTLLTPPETTLTTPELSTISTGSFVGALNEIESDICFNDKPTFACPIGFAFMLIDAFYGVKQLAADKCQFVQGDCVQDATSSTINSCRHDQQTCYLPYTAKRRLAQCNDNYADYLHITYQCIPSRGLTSGLKTFDICETTNPIDEFNGLMISPGFPIYQQTNRECQRSILEIRDKALKIWLIEMAVSSGGQRKAPDDSNEADLIIHKTGVSTHLSDEDQLQAGIRDICPKDYLVINAPHLAYVYCGTRKLVLPPICADQVYIQYQTMSPPSFFHKGFKLYFEMIDRPLGINCGSGVTIDPSATTTTPGNVPLSIWAQNLDVSPVFRRHICLGSIAVAECERPNDYVLSLIDVYFGVTGTGTCESPSISHCRQETSLSQQCTHSCLLEYILPQQLSLCSNAQADYLSVDYSCIPTRLPNGQLPIDICASTTTNTIAINKGMLTSPQYPVLSGTRSCSKIIETIPSQIWKIYLVDISLESENSDSVCAHSSLTIVDGNETLILCGVQPPTLVFASCSNIVQFKFVSNQQGFGYRGFKVLFETMDVPSDWSCGTATTTTKKTTPSPLTTTLRPPSLQIAAFGGTTNGTLQFCTLPFIYQGSSQASCIITENPPTAAISLVRATEPWCSLTDNFDQDHQWGYCDLSVTDSTLHDICRNNQQTLECPPGYHIAILSAEYAAKPAGNTTGTAACTYDRNDCFQNDDAIIQSTCAGKTSCIAFHFAKTLTSCQNRPSDYFHINYVCVPSTVQGITTYELCSDTPMPTNGVDRGYLISPNYLNTNPSLDCTFVIQTSNLQREIHVYVLEMDLSPPEALGKPCSKDRLITNYDSAEQEYCGRSNTNFLFNTCHSSVRIQLIRAADAKRGGVKFYFEFRERPPNILCPVITTPASTTRSPLGSTTIAPLPSYFPDPSPLQFKTLCYPDLSGLFGVNNLQCPQDYALVIRRAFYGKGNRCDFTQGDCTSDIDLVYRTCAGKQACSVTFYSPVTLPDCNREIANYLFIEYQCLPTPSAVPQLQDLCTAQINQVSGVSGILTSASYPSYVPTQCTNVTLSSPDNSNLYIYMYLLELDIGSADSVTGACTNDYLSLSYQCNKQLYEMRLCGTRKTSLLFATCSPTDQIYVSYSLTDPNSPSRRGFALAYHFLAKPDFTSTLPMTTTAIATTPGSWIGPVSTTVEEQSVCVQQSLQLRCTLPDYVLVLHKIDLAVSKTPGFCQYSPDDCFEDRTQFHTICSAQSSCLIYAHKLPIRSCNNSLADYLYVSYQCLPTRPNVNLDVCTTSELVQRVYSGALVSSLNYTSSVRNCKVQLEAEKLLGSDARKGFKIFILMLNLPVTNVREQRSTCTNNDPHVEINDFIISLIRICGNQRARLLFETTSNTVEVTFRDNNRTPTTTKYKGFQLYFEAANESNTPVLPSTIQPVTPTEPFVIKRETICALSLGRERVSFGCTPNHGLVFRQSLQFVTQNPSACDINIPACHWQSKQPQSLCGGQESCTFIYTLPPGPALTPCQNRLADLIEFHYQCIPLRPSTIYPTARFCLDDSVSFTKGFIETPGYPSSYPYTAKCALRISLTGSTADKPFFIHLYIIDMSLRDTSATNPSGTLVCTDMISYDTGLEEKQLCGNVDQPILEYRTNATNLDLMLDTGAPLPSDDLSNLRGARLFFTIDDQPMSTTPSPITKTTNAEEVKPTAKAPGKSGHGEMIAGIVLGVMVALLVLIGFILYRRRLAASRSQTPQVRYQTGTDTVDSGLANGAKGQSSSITVASLKNQTSLVNPVYRLYAEEKLKDHQPEDSSNA